MKTTDPEYVIAKDMMQSLTEDLAQYDRAHKYALRMSKVLDYIQEARRAGVIAAIYYMKDTELDDRFIKNKPLPFPELDVTEDVVEGTCVALASAYLGKLSYGLSPRQRYVTKKKFPGHDEALNSSDYASTIWAPGYAGKLILAGELVTQKDKDIS